MKKPLKALALCTVIMLTACGSDEAAPQSSDDRTKEQLLQRIAELEEENKALKAGGSTTDLSNEETAEEIMDEWEDEEDTTEVAEAPSSGNEQFIQSQPGTATSDKYFKLEGKYGTYEQTGDMFVTVYEYDNSQILVIPIKFTNTSAEATDPWMAIIGDYTAKQEDDNQEYLLMGGQGSTPEEYDNPLDIKIKPGGETEWYLSYTLQLPNQDVLLIDDKTDEVVYTFKFQN